MKKEGRSIWKKLIKGFWITAGVLVVIFIIFISTVTPPDADKSDLYDNQRYEVSVSHAGTTYIYYCTEYSRNFINGSFILIDYKGEPSHELFIGKDAYFRISKNANYKEIYFEEYFKELEKKKAKEKISLN